MRLIFRCFIASSFALSLSACGGHDDPIPPTDGGGDGDAGPGGDAATDGAVDDAGDGGAIDAGRDAGPAECGNFEEEGDEVCDDGNTDGGDGCSADCLSNEVCGNGYLDDALGEVCDDGNTVNGDGCSADCTSDESCGNGVVDVGVGEVCDDGNTDPGDGCSADCSMGPVCGDGVTNGGEACDDGNTDGGDGCSADCTSDESCGNGTVDSLAGEMCDDGNTTAGDGCSDTCSVEICGNGVTDIGEDCDDGNDIAADGCESDCTFSCTEDADCDDGAACNGSETCDTTTNACAAGTNLADGTDCGGGLVCRSGACVAPVCGNSIVEGTEDCDDGNSTNGDGCDTDCTFSCTMDAECDDGQVCTGDETCNTTTHRCTNPPDLADGTACGSGLVCRSGVCTTIVCGNGFMESGEECDDGNTTEGDGCDNDCTFSCATNADCTDGLSCNGSETCNTTTHVCAAGTPAADGTVCDRDMMSGTRDVCRGGTCLSSTCGDGYVDTGSGEQCEDGNTTNGDGCDNDCTFSCSVAADCDDGRVCNGAETCNTTTHVCAGGSPPPDGTLCDRDMNASTRDICRTGTCSLSECGDGYVDAGRGETCDDGNLVAGDGCEPDCTVTGAPPPTAFRIDEMDLMDPHFFVSVFGCRDVTENPFLGFSVNGALNDEIDAYNLNYVDVFRPLDIAAASTPMDLVIGATCSMGPSRDTCSVGMGSVTSTTANNRPLGMTCYTADPSTLTAMYTPEINVVTGPCFVTDPRDIVVDINGIAVPLQGARMAATYSGGSPPTTLVSGVISGFLTEADAQMIILPDTLPLVGGDTLYEHLAAGRASGSSCASHDDRDTRSGVVGFWFYLNFHASLADWTSP